MSWIPRVEGKNVAAINARTGSKKILYCSAWKGATSVSVVSAEEFVVHTGDGHTRVWNVRTGGLKVVGT
jgi:hypothetical protein